MSSRRLFSHPRYRTVWVPEVPLDATQTEGMEHIRVALDAGEIALEEVGCCFCGSDLYDTIAERDRYGVPVVTALCRECGAVYRRRRLAERSAEAFYRRFYDRVFKGRITTRAYFGYQADHARAIAAFLGERLSGVENIVEFGAGPGGIASHFADQGYSCRAFDLNARYSAVDFPRSVEVVPGGIDAALVGDPQPDLVLLSHVLEHTYDPVAALAECATTLAPDGLLYVEVPGLHGYRSGHQGMCGCAARHPYRRDLLQGIVVAHNYEFDAHLLSLLLRAAGFEVLKCDDLVRVIARKVGAPGDGLPSVVEARRGWYVRNREYLLALERDRARWAPVYRTWDVLRAPLRALKRLVVRSRE